MSTSRVLQETQIVTLAAGAEWYLPMGQYADARGWLNAYALLDFGYLSTSGGNLTAYLESAPALSFMSAGWPTVASESNITAAGFKTLNVVRNSGVPLGSWLRVRIVAASAAVTFTVRIQLLFKEPVVSKEVLWFSAKTLSFTASGTQYLPADEYLDTEDFLNVVGLCDWSLISGSSADLAVNLQSAPDVASEAAAWVTIGSVNLANATPFISGRVATSTGPMGAIRLSFVAAAALSGTLRMPLIFKQT